MIALKNQEHLDTIAMVKKSKTKYLYNGEKLNVKEIYSRNKKRRVDLLGYPICNSSQENAIVIDTFGGSGSTMMACEQANRTCYMCELDEKYASVILRRAVENGIAPDDIYVERGVEKLMYSDLVKELDEG